MWRLFNNSFNTGNLQNRNGTWKYEEKIFTIPDEGITGIIKDQVWGIGHGYVLGRFVCNERPEKFFLGIATGAIPMKAPIPI